MSRLEKHHKKLGKAQAREQFAPIVESLSKDGGLIEVTDYGKTAAVIMGYKDYLVLIAQSKEPFKPKRQLAGSAVLLADIEEASKQISETLIQSIEKTSREL